MPDIKKVSKAEFSLYKTCKPQFSRVTISLNSKANINLMQNESKLEVKKNGRISYSR